jgi:hypothetical protein
LNTLNDKIVFFYYTKYRSGDIGNCIDIKNNIISLQKHFKRKKGITGDDKFRKMKSEFPYYYKMLNLYAHLCAILDVEERDFCGTFLTIIGNMIENYDNPKNCVKSMFEDVDADSVYEKRNDKFVNKKKRERINTEIKVLMRHANNLHKDFNRYGDNETQFEKESGLEDYMYLLNEKRQLDKDLPDYLDPMKNYGNYHEDWVPYTTTDIDDLNDEFAKLCVVPEAHHSIKTVSNTSFVQMPNKNVTDELQKLSELCANNIISKQTAEKMMTDIILKSKNPNLVVKPEPKASSGLILRRTEEEYKKLQSMGPMIDNEMMKRILEETKKT